MGQLDLLQHPIDGLNFLGAERQRLSRVRKSFTSSNGKGIGFLAGGGISRERPFIGVCLVELYESRDQ